VNTSYFPSKKIWILIGLIVLGAAVIFIIYNKPSTSGLFGLATSPSVERPNELDSDEDGLPDWKEKLWNTDINNPDTDGDGTTDGDEVATGRDPAKAGADFVPAGQVDSTSLGSTARSNLTDQVRSKLLPQAVVLAIAQQNGEDISTEDIDRITTAIANDVKTRPRQYGTDDLVVNQENSKEALSTYAQNLQQTLLDRLPSGPGPILIIARALQENDFTNLDEITPYRWALEQGVIDLLDLEVPSSLAAQHLRLLNGLQVAATSLGRLENANGDNVSVMIAIQNYREASLQVNESATMLWKSLGSQLQEN